MAEVLIALGGNVGDVRSTFQKAIANICGMTQAALLARSSDYATPPWGEEQQARFVNACIEIETSLDPHALLFTLHKIEKKFGRDRAHERRWGPRTLDLDLIAYDDVELNKPDATAPPAVRARLRAGAAGGDRARPGDRRPLHPGRAGTAIHGRNRAATRPGLAHSERLRHAAGMRQTSGSM
jgi:2-amino-4-hydroxy-6-hydroxymethyldihydropteridine diphosphokinase